MPSKTSSWGWRDGSAIKGQAHTKQPLLGLLNVHGNRPRPHAGLRQQRATWGLPARDSELLYSMSVIFAPDWLRGKAKVNQETIQRLLEENDQLIRCIVEYQNKGRANECVQYQHVLHRNLIYLATIADANTSSLTKAVE